MGALSPITIATISFEEHPEVHRTELSSAAVYGSREKARVPWGLTGAEHDDGGSLRDDADAHHALTQAMEKIGGVGMRTLGFVVIL